MPELFVYLLKINIAAALFYLGYFFFLKKLTFYSWNRMYLLVALVFSAVFPFLKLPEIFNKPVVVGYGFEEIGASLALIPQVEEKQSILWLGLSLLYWVGMIFGAVKMITGFVSLYRVHIRSVSQCWNGYYFRNLKEEVAPFSFLGTIYLNKEMHSDQELNTVLKHEEEHTKGLHSLDVLLIEIWSVFSWFSPVTYFIKKAIKVNIEFIADREVITRGVPHQEYQTNLVHFAAKSAYIPLVNQFSFLSLKSRIIMMNKKQSSKRQLGKYVLLIPLILTSLFVFGISKAYHVTRGGEFIADVQPIEERQVITEISTAEDIPFLLDSAAVEKSGLTVQKEEVRDSAQKVLEKPLVVIDGVVQDKLLRGNGLDKVSPDNIESMTVLKDESATALYGEKGKHGVILLTTKNAIVPDNESKEESLGTGSSAVITKRKRESAANDVAQEERVVTLQGQIPLTKVVGYGTTTREGSPIGLMFGDSTTTSFKIRDKEAVVYMIDGQRGDGAAILKLDPDQIQSIEVIKGGKATALYGDKAKDGVIMIKTKK